MPELERNCWAHQVLRDELQADSDRFCCALCARALILLVQRELTDAEGNVRTVIK